MLSTDPSLIPDEYSGMRDFKNGLDPVTNANRTLVNVKLTEGLADDVAKTYLGAEQTASDWNNDVPVLGWISGSIVGLITGDWTDVSLSLKGGYLGDYHLTFTIDPVAADAYSKTVALSDVFNYLDYSKGTSVLASMRQRMQELNISSILATIGSPWINTLNSVAPILPNGNALTIVPLYSDDVSPLEAALIQSIGGTGTQVCQNDSKLRQQPGCFAAEDYIESMISKKSDDWVNVDVSINGDFFKTFSTLRDQWFSKSDIAVEAVSQQYSSRIPRQQYDVRVARGFLIHQAAASIPLQKMVVHGGIGSINGIPVPEEPKMGNDIFCSLDDYCSANVLTGDPIQLLDQTLAITMAYADAQGAAQSSSVQTATVSVQGDFDVSTVATNSGDLQGVVVLDGNNQVLANVGVNSVGSVFSGTTVLGTFGHIPTFQLNRTGNTLVITAKDQNGQAVTYSATLPPSSVLKVGTFTTGTSTNIPVMVAKNVSLVNPANQVPAIPTPNSQSATSGGVFVLHRETRGQESNVSKPRILLINRTAQDIHGFKLYYYFTADPARNPTAVADYAPNQNVTVENLGGDQYRMIVDGSNITLASHKVFPSQDGDQFRLFNSKDYTSWYLWDDWSENHNYGTPKANDKIVVTDLNGNVLWGTAPNLSTAAGASSITPQVTLLSKDQGIQESNDTKPEVELVNTGAVPIKDFHVEYYFRVPAGKVLSNPALWPAVDQATPSVRNVGGNLWVLDWHFNEYIVYPGDTITSGMVGLYYSDWSSWNKSNDPSYLATSSFAENANLVFRLGDGTIISGTVPTVGGTAGSSSVVQTSSASSSDFIVRIKNESDAQTLKPRFTVTNNSNRAVSGFQLNFEYETEGGNVPVLDALWYTPGCQGQNQQLSGDLWQIVLTCSNLDLEPGGVWPDQTGAIFGVHYTNWAAWDISNDPCMVGVGASLTPAPVQVSNIQVK